MRGSATLQSCPLHCFSIASGTNPHKHHQRGGLALPCYLPVVQVRPPLCLCLLLLRPLAVTRGPPSCCRRGLCSEALDSICRVCLLCNRVCPQLQGPGRRRLGGGLHSVDHATPGEVGWCDQGHAGVSSFWQVPSHLSSGFPRDACSGSAAARSTAIRGLPVEPCLQARWPQGLLDSLSSVLRRHPRALGVPSTGRWATLVCPSLVFLKLHSNPASDCQLEPQE